MGNAEQFQAFFSLLSNFIRSIRILDRYETEIKNQIINYSYNQTIREHYSEGINLLGQFGSWIIIPKNVAGYINIAQALKCYYIPLKLFKIVSKVLNTRFDFPCI